MCRVPDFHQLRPRGPEQWHHSQPSAAQCRDSTTSRKKEGDTTVGTSTNCSTSCGSRSGARCGMVSSRVIVGDSIACSTTTGSVTKNLTTSADWSTICGTGTSTVGTGTKDSMIGSTVCRRTCACGPATSSRPPSSSSSKTSQNSASLPLADFWPLGRCTARAPPTPPSTGQNGTRSGGAFQLGPGRRSSVRAEASNGGVAPSCASRSLW